GRAGKDQGVRSNRRQEARRAGGRKEEVTTLPRPFGGTIEMPDSPTATRRRAVGLCYASRCAAVISPVENVSAFPSPLSAFHSATFRLCDLATSPHVDAPPPPPGDDPLQPHALCAPLCASGGVSGVAGERPAGGAVPVAGAHGDPPLHGLRPLG